jgi:predicted transcriptional regulator
MGGKARSLFERYLCVIQESNNVKISHLMRKSNCPFITLHNILDFLIFKGYIREGIENKCTTYNRTQLGIDVLKEAQLLMKKFE